MNKVIENLQTIADMEVRVHVIGDSPEAITLRLRERVAALEAKNAQLKTEWAEASDTGRSYLVRIRELEAENARLRTDAELARNYLDIMRKQKYKKPASWGVPEL